MREEGLYGEAMSDWMMGSAGGPALLVGFTNIASQAEAEKLGRRILKLL
jgi:GntR family transcriptional regulator/MocR family aminotransferase